MKEEMFNKASFQPESGHEELAELTSTLLYKLHETVTRYGTQESNYGGKPVTAIRLIINEPKFISVLVGTTNRNVIILSSEAMLMGCHKLILPAYRSMKSTTIFWDKLILISDLEGLIAKFQA